MTGKPKTLSASAKAGIGRAIGRINYRTRDLIENGDTVEAAGDHYYYVGRSRINGMCVIQHMTETTTYSFPYSQLKLIRKRQS